MAFRWRAALFGGSAIMAISGGALAQSPPPRSAQPAATQPLYNPDQLPVLRGRVQQFTLTPRGDIDGLILTDGTEVDTPPYLSTQIAYAVKPGDMVTIHGLHAAALPLVRAVSVTDDATGRTVIDTGPPGPGRGPMPPPPAAPATSNAGSFPRLTEVQGKVRIVLRGPQGDPNGALLDDGAIVRLPPPEAYRFATMLQPGQTIVAEGTELVTPMGRVLDAEQLGPSRNQLSLVATPPRPGPGGPPPPPPGSEPPPGPPRP